MLCPETVQIFPYIFRPHSAHFALNHFPPLFTGSLFALFYPSHLEQVAHFRTFSLTPSPFTHRRSPPCQYPIFHAMSYPILRVLRYRLHDRANSARLVRAEGGPFCEKVGRRGNPRPRLVAWIPHPGTCV